MVKRQRREDELVEMMREKLAENRGKGDWDDLDTDQLLELLETEVEELSDAISAGDSDEIIREAADVANFAAMIVERVSSR